jgi:hypothetical protein
MRNIFRTRVKSKTGKIELEGSKIFVEKKMIHLHYIKSRRKA